MPRHYVFTASLIVLYLAAALVWAGAAETQPATGPATQPKPVSVTVFATGDIHEHTLWLARIAAHVKAAKAKDPNVLLLDAGDQTHQYGEKPLRATNGEGMYRLMVATGYDAIVFGNHDHGMGRSRLIELKRKLPELPLLAATIAWKKEPEDLSKLFPPYKIFQLQGVKVAVIGASSDEVRYTRRNRFVMYHAPSVVHQLVPVLRKEADIVIAVTHQFEGLDYGTATGPNAPDLIVGGHSHGGMAQPYGRKRESYIIKAGRYTRYLAKAVLKWDGRKIVERTGEVTRVDKGWPEDPKVKALRDSYFKAAEKKKGETSSKKQASTGRHRIGRGIRPDGRTIERRHIVILPEASRPAPETHRQRGPGA